MIMMMVFVPSEWGTTDPAILQWLYHALFSLVWVGVVGSILLLLSLPLNVIAVFREPVRRWRVVSGAMGGVLLIRLTWGVYDAAATPYVDRDDWAKSVRQEYLKDEGHADRGERFAEYVLLLDQDVFAGTR
ncbi:MAG: hypothetical protein QGH74_07150, partial [Candidatus Brocadiia bacterium]|nr:hypothetical protein [Candidatus Brocadiia bacterium]